MDSSPTTLVPAAGLASAIVALVGIMLRAIIFDRREFRKQIAGEQARTAAAEERLEEERQRADAAQGRVDAELERRRAAEHELGVARAELDTARHRLSYWVEEAHRLRRHLPPGPVLPDPRDHDDG
jgi:uncharacterized protein (DUF3084 family)